jgi:peptidoglycan/LPS O-acetylase OafA/YrhL
MPPPRNFHPAYRRDIDGLRALAVLLVVTFHAFPRWMPAGFIGVDIFFVISGYLISQIIFRSLAEADFSFGEFYAHRIRRIFPALILVLLAVYVAGWFLLLPDEYKLLGKHIAGSMGFVQNFMLWREAGYFDVASEIKPLLHLWSLAVEEQFYLIFPVTAWLLWRLNLNLLTFVVFSAFVSFWISHKGVHGDAVKAFFAPQSRFWELMVGASLAHGQIFNSSATGIARLGDALLFNRIVFRRLPDAVERNSIRCNALSLLGGLLLLYALCALNRDTPFPGSRALAPVLGALLLIAAGPTAWFNRQILSRKPMVAIGLISYPLYLWHWPLLSLAHIIEDGMPERKIRILAVLTSILLAALTYRIFEKPMRYGPHPRLKTTVLAVLGILVVCIGYNTWRHDGLSFRMKNLNAQLAPFEARNTPWLPENQEPYCRTRVDSQNQDYYCRLKHDAAPTLMILGDSHGVALYPGLRDSQLSGNPLDLGRGSCPPLAGVRTYHLQNENNPDEIQRCEKVIERGLTIAEQTRAIQTVILASRGPAYLLKTGFQYPGEQFPDEAKKDNRLVSLLHPEISDQAIIWQMGLRASIERLIKAGKRVVVLLDNPELGFDPRACIDQRPIHFTHRPRPICGVPRSVFDARNRDYRTLMTHIVADYPGVLLVDAAKPFCDDQWCWAMKDGQLFYRDDDHLALNGAKLVAREIQLSLEKSAH